MATVKKIIGRVPVSRGPWGDGSVGYAGNVFAHDNMAWECLEDNVTEAPSTASTKWRIWSGAPILQEEGTATTATMSQGAVSGSLGAIRTAMGALAAAKIDKASVQWVTEAEYEAMAEKDPDVTYIIYEEEE